MGIFWNFMEFYGFYFWIFQDISVKMHEIFRNDLPLGLKKMDAVNL